MTGFKKNVVGFNIPMQNMQLIERPECIDDLFENPESLFFWQMAFSSDEVFQGSSLAKLIHQVYVVVGLDHLHKVDHIDVRL